jgi:dGTPase
VAAVWVMTAESRRPVHARQRELLAELVAALVSRAPDGLAPPFAMMWAQARDDGGRWRVVIDQVASLTDGSAARWHQTVVR